MIFQWLQNPEENLVELLFFYWKYIWKDIIGSAEALPILCVSDFCERERERERDAMWRHRYHAEIASDHAYDYLDGAFTLRVDAFWACLWVLEVHVKTVQTRSLALESSIEQQGRVIDEWRRRSGSFAFAGRPAVDHPAANCWHASSKKNRPSWCIFSFEWQRFCLWEQLG